MQTQKANEFSVTWGDEVESDVVLTGDMQFSNDVMVDFTKRGTLYALWTPGASTRTLQFQIQVNPYPVNKVNQVTTITNDEYWSTYGSYTESTGTMTPTALTYESEQSTDTDPLTIVPILIPQIDASRMRIGVMEDGATSDGGTVKFIFIENTIN